MVDCQIHTSGVVSQAVLESFGNIPREKFVSTGLTKVAYTDEEIAAGEGRFLLKPAVHAKMLQAAEPSVKDIALDIGGASGYSAAILSPMVSTVIAVESERKFLGQAGRLWEELGIMNVVGVEGKLAEGFPAQAPFDLIFLNGAAAEIPQKLMAQLADGGRMVAILRKPGGTGQVTLVRRTGASFSRYPLFEASAPYIPGLGPKESFSF
ncbi:MAG: protein-L-isoaspartate O-methyltransferase [Alphaproteobacteria bacterium]|nr:protein-L-isoaspartate O-methyltransferase [Alphaproteobacteria bacterium]